MDYHILVQLLTGLSCSGNEEKLLALLTPLNVNCHASDGRKSTPLHLAAGYNRTRIVQLLLTHGADVHAKDKGGLVPLHNACSYGHFEVTVNDDNIKSHHKIIHTNCSEHQIVGVDYIIIATCTNLGD